MRVADSSRFIRVSFLSDKRVSDSELAALIRLMCFLNGISGRDRFDARQSESCGCGGHTDHAGVLKTRPATVRGEPQAKPSAVDRKDGITDPFPIPLAARLPFDFRQRSHVGRLNGIGIIAVSVVASAGRESKLISSVT